MNKDFFDRTVDKICSFLVACLIVSCLQPLLIKICNKYINIQIDNIIISYIKNDLYGFLFIDKENSIILIFLLVSLFFIVYILCKRLLNKISLREYITLKDRSTTRFKSVDVIKTLGALFVILVHTYISIGFYERNVNDPIMYILIFIVNILTVCVPIFFSMTGYLSINKPVSLKHYVGWFRYLIPYALINLFVFFYNTIVYKQSFSFLQCFTVYTNGYMSCFFGLFLLAPFLNKLWENLNGRCKVGLIFVLLFLTIIPSVTGMMITRYWTILGSLLYFYTGAFLREYRIQIKSKLLIFSLIGISVLETIYAIFKSTDVFYNAYFWDCYDNNCNIYVILPTYFLTVIIIILIDNKKCFSKITTKLSEIVSKYTLEMYWLSGTFSQVFLWRIVQSKINLTYNLSLLISPIVIFVEIIFTFILSVIFKKIGNFLYNKLYNIIFSKLNKQY